MLDNFKFLMRFLKNNDAYYQYKKEIPQYRIIQWNKEKCRYLPHQFLDYAFTWAGTRQGHNYWSALYLKLQKEENKRR